MSVGDPSENVEQCLLVFVTILHSISVAITCFRLWVRVRLHRLWWEDAWAALALCLDIVCAISTWTLIFPQRDGPRHTPQESHIISVWLVLLSYTCLIWAARMSILFSLLRIVPPSSGMRRITSGSAVFFIFLWALCAASKVYTCASNRSWYNLSDFPCPIGLPISVIEFTTDLISDVILVALPTRILWQMNLPRSERIILLSIFSMSLLSVVASIVHVAFLIPSPEFTASITADIQGALDLMICNLLVLVTTLYRFFRNGEDIERTDKNPSLTANYPGSSSSQTATMHTLTTIDLECFETMSSHSTQSAPIPQSDTVSVHNPMSQSCFDVSVGCA